MRGLITVVLAVCGLVHAACSPAVAGPALLFDAGSGKVLYSEDPDSKWHPASLTKIMTAYVVFSAIKQGKLKLDDRVSCSLVATLQPPSKVGLNVGATLTVEQALKAVIIKSANDVTVMLAEAVSGSERAFVDDMNAAAQKLGMTRTHFVNTNGLPEPSQVTTARDLAKLSRAIVTEFPEYNSFWAMPSMRIGGKVLSTHNALLRSFEGADGLKTGFICDSGFNVVASATREGRRLMAVVLGEASGNERAIRAASLLEHGFQTYGWKELFSTVSLDSLPLDAAAREAHSVRDEVVAWNCGNKKKKKSNTAAQRRAKALAEKRKTPKETQAAAKAGATQQPAETTIKLKGTMRPVASDAGEKSAPDAPATP